ncbi:polycystin-1-like protein 3 isoform X2 [Cololabis saira]|uniref:polycystin-1-like protein 3 isoform X2 n=1 Tax=Cololabis saira TaxID=129043 RepID=UPI002AD5557D|nr:polycystin-1-like protein 3 isoform X2 [Cololabis saira]
MSARLLRPLKCLQVDSWGVLMGRPTLHFCSQAKDPQNPTKKTQAPVQTCSSAVEAPADRAALLAYKTQVVFPVRLSEPGFFPSSAAPAVASTSTPTPAPPDVSAAALASTSTPTPSPPDVSAAALDSTSTPTPAPPHVSAPALAPEHATAAANDVAVFSSDSGMSVAAESSSTSSSSSDSESDSDSDSDSDAEDNKSELQSGKGTSLLEKPDIQEFAVTGRTKDAADAECEALRATVKRPTVSSDQSDALGPEASTATQDPAELLDPHVPAGKVAQEAAEGCVAVDTATTETPGLVEMPAVYQEKNLTESESESPPTDTAGLPESKSTPTDTAGLPESESPPTDTAGLPESESPPTDTAGPVESESPPTDTAGPVESESPPTDTAGLPESESPPTDTAGPVESESPPTDTAGLPESESPPTGTAGLPESESPPTDTAGPVESESPPTDTAGLPESESPPTGTAGLPESESPLTNATGPVELESLVIETVTEFSSPSEELLDPAQVLSESTEKEMVEVTSGPSEGTYHTNLSLPSLLFVGGFPDCHFFVNG